MASGYVVPEGIEDEVAIVTTRPGKYRTIA
jgi:hypothetical protein